MSKQKIINSLYELVKNSKRSDRELAKIVGVSQPTITRMRKNLEKSGNIREYTIMPALEKLGFEIIALKFLLTSIKREKTREIHEWILENPKILFSSLGEDLNGKMFLAVSIHKNFIEFSAFTRELRSSFELETASLENFPVSLKTDNIEDFSFNNMERIS